MSAAPAALPPPVPPPPPRRDAPVVRTVPVVVRSRSGSTPAAGRMWGTSPTSFDASPNDVRDLLSAGSALAIEWPDGYVAPSGIRLGAVASTADMAPAPILSIAERLAAAECEAALHRAAASANGKELTIARALIADLERGIAYRDEQLRSQPQPAADTTELEQRVANLLLDLEAVRANAEKAARYARADHDAAIDTLHAQHRNEIETVHAQYERQIAKLTADLEAAAAATAKPK